MASSVSLVESWGCPLAQGIASIFVCAFIALAQNGVRRGQVPESVTVRAAPFALLWAWY
jgi:hypothetical protein